MLSMKIMAKRVSKIARSLKKLKKLGDVQVVEWDFIALMNTEIRELEIARSLSRLGSIQVMEWDFRSVLEVVKETARQEVDLVDLFKRTAQYKVMDWDFRSSSPAENQSAPRNPPELGEHRNRHSEMPAITARLKNFLQYVTVSLIAEPEHAQIKVTEMGPTGLRFKLVLAKKDVMLLIGREGHTASAIRNILKASAARYGMQALLQIHSHEEEAAFLAKEQARR
jgi:predicted RNA-binding protein YlqC (UPF0109 family)